MIPLVVCGLLAIVYLLLKEHEYITFGSWPDGLGWWFQLVNGKRTWGFRIQGETYPAPWKGRWWRYEAAAPWLGWPRALRFSIKKVKVFIYLGTAKR